MMSLRSGFVLGKWTVYPLEGRLVANEETRRVQPKSMDVLLCLAEAGGEVVERDELLRRIWGDRAISDEPLTRCIGELRRALGDTRSESEYILTIPKRGYRLLQSAVSTSAAGHAVDEADQPPLTLAQKARRLGTLKKLAAGLGLLVLAALVQIGIEKLLDQPAVVDEPGLVAPESIARSIAVLPFVDMSAAKNQEYMSDGIAEELLNLLAKIRELRVISRSSAFSFKGRSVDIRTIAEQFNVGYVLEGSVRKSGDNIRITAQLVDARTDTHVWSETYDRELNDIFAIQDEIAQAVVSKLEVTLLGDAPKSRPTDPEAYSLFLQARYLHEQPAGDSFQRAFEYYNAALEIDEKYVPAWVWLAALYDDTVNSLGLPYDEVGRLARDAIQRALEIDPDDPLALGMSGVLIQAWDHDLAGAAAQMQKAIERDPSNPILLRWAAIVLNSLGRYEEANRVNEYLFARDPVGGIAKINLASTYLSAGRYEDAIRLCEIQVALSSERGPCGSRLILAYLYFGDTNAALGQLEQTSGSRVYTRLAPMVFHGLGQQANFEKALADLFQAYEDGDKGLAYWIAHTYSFVGDTDAMFLWFERALDEGVLGLPPGAAFFAKFENDPRWENLMKELGNSPDVLRAIHLDVRIPD